MRIADGKGSEMDHLEIDRLSCNLAYKIAQGASLAVVKEYVEKGARVDYYNVNCSSRCRDVERKV